MKIFDIKEDVVRLTPEARLLDEVQDILAKYKENALQVIAYCEFFTNPESPYSNLEEKERMEMLEGRYLLPYKAKATDSQVSELVSFLLLAYTTPVIRQYRTAVILSDKLCRWAENLDITDLPSAKLARETLEKMPSVIKSLKAALKEKEEDGAKARGNKKIAYDQ